MKELEEFVKMRENYERTLVSLGLDLERLPCSAGDLSLSDQLNILTDLTERSNHLFSHIETTKSVIQAQIQKYELKALQAENAMMENLCSESESDESMKSEVEVEEFVKLRENFERTLVSLGLDLERLPCSAGDLSLSDQLNILTDLTERGKHVFLHMETTKSVIQAQIQKYELKALQAENAMMENLCSESESDESMKSALFELSASTNAILNRQEQLDMNATQVDMEEIFELCESLEEQELSNK